MLASWFLTRRDLGRNPVRGAAIACSVLVGVAVLVAAHQISRSITVGLSESAEMSAVTNFMGEQLGVGLRAMGLIASAAAAFITFNSLRLSVVQRKTSFSRLRSVGMVRSQIRAAVLLEAASVGLAGALAGIPAGLGLSWVIIRLMEATSPVMNQFGWAPLQGAALIGSAGLGLGIALMGAYLPARRAAVQATEPGTYTDRLPQETRPTLGRAAAPLGAGLALLVVLAIFPPGRWVQAPWGDRLAALFLTLWIALVSLSAPGSIEAVAAAVRRPLEGILGAPGRLGIDNSLRSQGRATSTALTLMIGVAMIIGVSGFLNYWFEELFFRTMDRSSATRTGIGLAPVDLDAGLQGYMEVESLTLSSDLLRQIREVVSDRGVVAETFFLLEPQLSFMGDHYFSFVLDPAAIKASDGLYFALDESSWEAVEADLQRGCGLFISPAVAARATAQLGDVLMVGGAREKVACRVTGIGPTFVGASIISLPEASALGLSAPVVSFVFPDQGTDLGALRRDLEALAESTPGAWMMDLTSLRAQQVESANTVRSMMQGMLVLAVIAGGLGALNTLLIGLQERGRELAVLRACGATRPQLGLMLMTEAMAYGLYGGAAGAIGGLGLTLILPLTLGGSPLGFADFPVHEAARNTFLAALPSAMAGLLITPLITGFISLFAALRSQRVRSSQL